MCYLILEGTIAVYRRSDNMMLSTARSPGFGLANLTDIYFSDYLKTVSPCLIGTITRKGECHYSKKALWGLLSQQLMYV
jgi:hypothetical protein